MRYKNIIFDLDGTLLNTIEDLTDSVNFVCKTLGYSTYDVDTIKGFVGNGIRKLLERAVPNGLDNPDYEYAYTLFCNHYEKNCRNKTRPYDGIFSLLDGLKQQGCRMAIVSNKNHDAVCALNEEFFGEFINVAVGQSDATRKKPAPDTVFFAMEQLNAKNEDTLYIGDSEVDSATADNAGVDCVLVSWGFRDKSILEKQKAVMIVETPQEILDFIGGTNI
jgi:phosphoglycolate phosphatase